MEFKDLINKSEYEFIDISSEAYRCYHFKNGDSLTINAPIAVAVSKSGHRVLSEAGFSYFIPSADFQYILWKAKDGQPHFVK